MPIKESAKKASRQNQKRRAANLQKKRRIKDLLKEVKSLVSQKKSKEAKKLLPKAYKILDKAAKKGIIKKNTASRQKSRITKLVGGNKD